MVRRLPPGLAPVVAGSTPVVAFGDPSRAEVATLGINPSANEFLDDGELLIGAERRLATLPSLEAERLDQLTDAQVSEVVAECARYFQRRPFKRWFDPLDDLLQVAAGVSYYDGSACHLDLVQWATEPVWGGIRDRSVRGALLEEGTPHLRAQLARENVRLVLLNGRQVLDQVAAAGLVELDEVGDVPLNRGSCRLYRGTGGGIRWVGWSTNLQSSWGVSAGFKQALGARLSEVCAPLTEPALPARSVAPTIDPSGHLARGLRLGSKRELVDVLRHWLSESATETLGDIATFGGRPWLAVEIDNHEVVINADSKRAAVERFVQAGMLQPDRPWRVVANRRGRVNKVLPDAEAPSLPGWYAYLVRPLDEEGTI